MNKLVLSLVPKFTKLQTLVLRQDKPQLEDNAVESIANCCHDLQVLDLSKSFRLSDRSLHALAHGCQNLIKLNITDRAMYSLAQSQLKNKKPAMWGSVKSRNEDDGLRTLNISQCKSLTPSAVQAVCDTFPALHTCSGRHSLIMSGCLNLTSVHCACAVHAHRTHGFLPHSAH